MHSKPENLTTKTRREFLSVPKRKHEIDDNGNDNSEDPLQLSIHDPELIRRPFFDGSVDLRIQSKHKDLSVNSQ